jgi:hypothetical protein
MSALIIAFSPFITSALTGWLKGLPAFTTLTDNARPTVVRLLAAAVALAYVLAGMYVTGSITPDVLSNALNAFIFALLAWLGSLGIFHTFFQKVGVPAAPAA